MQSQGEAGRNLRETRCAGTTLPAGVEEADEGGRGVVGDAADPDDGPAGLAALPVLLEAPLQDAPEHRRRRGLARAETKTNTTLIRRATQDRLRTNRAMRQGTGTGRFGFGRLPEQRNARGSSGVRRW